MRDYLFPNRFITCREIEQMLLKLGCVALVHESQFKPTPASSLPAFCRFYYLSEAFGKTSSEKCEPI
jgi:hypothetical protein